MTEMELVDAMLNKSLMATKFPKGMFPTGYLPPPTVYKSHDILFCGIAKNAISQFRALLCRTLDRKPGAVNDKIQLTIANNPYRAHYMALCKLNETLIPNNASDTEAQQLWSETVRKFAVLRDPIERFISGVIDKCLRINKPCFGCFNPLRRRKPPRKDSFRNYTESEALSCFAEKNKRAIANIWQNKRHPTERDHSINHFMPQYWFCDFQTRLNEYTLLYYNKSEAFKESARKLLLSWEVDKSLIRRGWGIHLTTSFLGVATSHASSKSYTQRYREMILSNLTLMNSIFTEFYVDYHYFKFRLPGETANLCSAAGPTAWTEYEICGAIQIKNWPLHSVPKTE